MNWTDLGTFAVVFDRERNEVRVTSSDLGLTAEIKWPYWDMTLPDFVERYVVPAVAHMKSDKDRKDPQ